MIKIHLKENGKSLLLNIDYLVSVSGNRLIDLSEYVYDVKEDFEELEQIIDYFENQDLTLVKASFK